jgi:hypothetical protein
LLEYLEKKDPRRGLTAKKKLKEFLGESQEFW